MKETTDIEQQLGELHSTEKEDLLSVAKSIELLVDDGKVNPQMIDSLEDFENTIRILKSKLYKRLLHLIRLNHMI